jgi:hypothetical protein
MNYIRGVKMPTLLIYKELNHLVDDYYKCPDVQIKKQILADLKFLTDALLVMEHELDSDITLKFCDIQNSCI